ncbi:Hypothetical predicted protein [Paramuricea clavata]|uniref:Uncharacterized protein n=1 Tax=Paramuricea clavata TaxID=317549 RepID=A0A7D9DZR2_PARCT|nr:Hypothetical predicted protein [Paramuricea clavata]
MENFRTIIERCSPFSIKLLSRRYVVTHLDRMKALLNREDAVASCLDMASYRQYVDELEHNWQNNLHMGCCVVRKDDRAERPIAMAIASANVYRADVPRPTELNWQRTNAYMDKEEQWCLEYLVRAREYCGSGWFIIDMDKDKVLTSLLNNIRQREDIGPRAHRKLVDTLTLRHGAAAAEQGAGGGADGGVTYP